MLSTALPMYSVRELVTWYARPRQHARDDERGMRQPTGSGDLPYRTGWPPAWLNPGRQRPAQRTIAIDNTDTTSAITEPTEDRCRR